jgi:hypothetical protein
VVSWSSNWGLRKSIKLQDAYILLLSMAPMLVVTKAAPVAARYCYNRFMAVRMAVVLALLFAFAYGFAKLAERYGSVGGRTSPCAEWSNPDCPDPNAPPR